MMKWAKKSKFLKKMPPCLTAKNASSETDLMFQFYLPCAQKNVQEFNECS